jgi:hypothetical protein
MKGVITSVAIFLVMLIGIFFSINYLNKVCTKLEASTIQIEKDIEGHSWDTAYDNSLNFLKEWTKYSHKVSMFSNHAEIDNVNNEIWKLTQYTKCKNEEESLASAHVIKFLLKHIVDMEKVNSENIF